MSDETCGCGKHAKAILHAASKVDGRGFLKVAGGAGDLADAKAEAEKLIAAAKVEAGKLKADATSLFESAKTEAATLETKAGEAFEAAKTEAEKLLSEARAEVAKLLSATAAKVQPPSAPVTPAAATKPPVVDEE